MSMVCPQCQQVHDKLLDCPQCRVRLHYHAAELEPASVPRDDERGAWQQAGWAKILVGLVLAQGLWYGLQNLFLAGLAAVEGEGSAEAIWHSLGGLILLHSLQGVSLLVGGALSGSGQARGAWCGALVGIANGLICVLSHRQDNEPLTQILTYATPLLHLAIGTLGGIVGMLVWKPSPVLPVFEVPQSPIPATPTERGTTSWDPFAGPVYVGRICTGVCVVVIGVVWAHAILEAVLRFTQVKVNYTSHLQAQLVSWEVSALATLIGAGFAGANTFAGLKQGLLTGAGAVVIVLGIQLGGPQVAIEPLLIMLGSTMALSGAGGWIGAQLLPPLDPAKRRRFI